MKNLISIKKLTSKAFICALFTGSLMIGFVSCDSSSASSGNFDFGSNPGSGQGVVDPDFEVTVARFLEEGEKRGITLDISDLDILYGETNGALGVCTRTANTRVITINTLLRNASEELLDEIILHELGHCALFRDHSDDPNSIMHATNIIGQPFREEVLDELFIF